MVQAQAHQPYGQGNQKNGGKLLNTAQHELGHSIGLEHNSAVASVMEPKGGKTSIQPVDINNVKKLYSKI